MDYIGGIGWKLDIIAMVLGGIGTISWIIHKQLAEILKDLKRRPL